MGDESPPASASVDVDAIRRLVFESTVPVRFAIPGLDVPLCFEAPRTISLGSFAWARLSFFLKDQARDLWFEHEGQHVKWELPLGVVADVYGQQPLEVCVRLEDFPAECTLRCDSQQTAAGVFDHSFKAAVFGSSGALDLVSQNTNIHRSVEVSVLEQNFGTFAALLGIKMADFEEWRKFPIRYVRRDQVVRQRLVSRGWRVSGMIHGIEVEDMEVEEVCAGLVFPDGFLYVVVDEFPAWG